MNIVKLAMATALGLTISGCGGGGDNSGFTDLGTETLRQIDKLALLSPSALLPSNTANYSGSLTIGDSLLTEGEFVVGTADLSANFDAGTVSGSANGFYELGGAIVGANAVGGSASISGSGLTGNSISLSVSGNVVLEDVNTTFNGTVPSQFYGANADMLYGEATNQAASGSTSTVDLLLMVD